MFAFLSENVTMWLSDFFRENLMIHVAGRRKEFNAVISVGLFIMDGWNGTVLLDMDLSFFFFRKFQFDIF